MNTFAYCCESFRVSTERAAGVRPLTSPPASAGDFDTGLLEGRDLLYFDLHGQPGASWWIGDRGLIALTAGQFGEVNLGHAVVFAVSCYLADQDSPMLTALLDAGARYVIGGPGENWGGGKTLMGAALLGLQFRRLLERDYDPLIALAVAKRWLQLGIVANQVMGKGRKAAAGKDALRFKAFYRK